MHDQTIPTSRLLALGLWGMTMLATIAMWCVFLLGHDHLAMVLAGTLTVLVGLAVVAHLRCYAIRAMKTLRLVGGLEDADRSTVELHRVR